jgi:alpha-L-arabinofuranosidase
MIRLCLLPALGVLLALLQFCTPSFASAQPLEGVVTIHVEQRLGDLNRLLFGQNVTAHGNGGGLWDSRTGTPDHQALELIEALSPTVLRFPGGSRSDRYFWEDGLGLRTTALVRPGQMSVPLHAPPAWGAVRKARLLGPGGPRFGDAFAFTGVDSSRLTGVLGISSAHPAGVEVRPEAREGQDEWSSNGYGIDEHMRLARELGADVVVTVNVGTGLDRQGRLTEQASLEQKVKRAAAWVAYLNGEVTDGRLLGTDPEGRDWHTVGHWARLRAERGHPAPFGVRWWEVGNELFGDWEAGHTTAADYARQLAAFARAMKEVDPTVLIGAAAMARPEDRGARDRSAPWNRTVLEHAGRHVDFLSVHPYYPAAEGLPYDSREWFGAVMAASAQALSDLKRVRQEVDALTPAGKRFGLALTEYGIWPAASGRAQDYSNLGRALSEAMLLLALVREGDRLGVDLAAGWNLHGNLQTSHIGFDWAKGERILRPQYHSLTLLSGHLHPVLLRTEVQAPAVPLPASKVGNVLPSRPGRGLPALDALASKGADGALSLIVVNRSLDRPLHAHIQVPGRTLGRASLQVLTADHPGAHNEDDPRQVAPRSERIDLDKNPALFLPPHSLTCIRFE